MRCRPLKVEVEWPITRGRGGCRRPRRQADQGSVVGSGTELVGGADSRPTRLVEQPSSRLSDWMCAPICAPGSGMPPLVESAAFRKFVEPRSGRRPTEFSVAAKVRLWLSRCSRCLADRSSRSEVSPARARHVVPTWPPTRSRREVREREALKPIGRSYGECAEAGAGWRASREVDQPRRLVGRRAARW